VPLPPPEGAQSAARTATDWPHEGT
jgi:hypothetical protein